MMDELLHGKLFFYGDSYQKILELYKNLEYQVVK